MQKYLVALLIFLVVPFSASESFCQKQQKITSISDQDKQSIVEAVEKYFDKKFAELEKKVTDQADIAKQTLSVSDATVKKVGTVATILAIFATVLLTSIAVLFGFQVYRSREIQKEFREDEQLISAEYRRVNELGTDAKKLLDETKSTVGTLETALQHYAREVEKWEGMKLKIAEMQEEIKILDKQKEILDQEIKKKLEELDQERSRSKEGTGGHEN